MGEHKDIYFKACKRLVAENGDCHDVDCDDCPFSMHNSGHKLRCPELGGFPSEFKSREDKVKQEAAQKYLDGSIVFHKGKLVEVIDDE